MRERLVHVGEGILNSLNSGAGVSLAFPSRQSGLSAVRVIAVLELSGAGVIIQMGLCGSVGAALSWSLSTEKVLLTLWLWVQADQSRLRRIDLSDNLI